jgi:hypothetical protein
MISEVGFSLGKIGHKLTEAYLDGSLVVFFVLLFIIDLFVEYGVI